MINLIMGTLIAQCVYPNINGTKNNTFGAHVRKKSWHTTMWTFTRSAVANVAAGTMSANVWTICAIEIQRTCLKARIQLKLILDISKYRDTKNGKILSKASKRIYYICMVSLVWTSKYICWCLSIPFCSNSYAITFQTLNAFSSNDNKE